MNFDKYFKCLLNVEFCSLVYPSRRDNHLYDPGMFRLMKTMNIQLLRAECQFQNTEREATLVDVYVYVDVYR